MDTIRIRLKRVADFGRIVCMSGVELVTGQPMTVTIERRASATLLDAWAETGLAPPVMFDAEHRVLTVELGEEGAANDA